MLEWIYLFVFNFALGGVISVAEAGDKSTSFHIRGDHLSNATEVKVDGRFVEFKVLSDQEIAIVPQIIDTQPIRISVTTQAGVIDYDLAAATSHDTSLSTLKVTSVNPMIGTSLGGTLATISGQGFKRRKLFVSFADELVTDLEVNSDSMLTVTVPAHGPGKADIKIWETGKIGVVLNQAFSYVAPPVINAVYPNAGSVAGGSLVTIQGSNFAKDSVRVFFGRAEAADVRVKDGVHLEVKAPGYTEGSVDIILINPDGQQGIARSAFVYLPLPVIDSVVPASGE